MTSVSRDINFPFVAFSHEQMKANTTQSFLLVDQSRFTDISQRLMNIDWTTLNELTQRMEIGEYVSPKTEAEKNCFQIIHDLDAISGKMHGSTTSKKYMRSEIWSLINYLGSPSWYITLSLADIQHPICIYFADAKEKFTPALPIYDERARLVCQNPVAGARFSISWFVHFWRMFLVYRLLNEKDFMATQVATTVQSSSRAVSHYTYICYSGLREI